MLVGDDLAARAGRPRAARDGRVSTSCWGRCRRRRLPPRRRAGRENVVDLPRARAGSSTSSPTSASGASPGLVVGVVGGAGGAGATTLACALAQVAAARASTLLVDADPLGPGLDRVLGMEDLAGVRWDGLCQTAGRLGARALREGVPRRDRARRPHLVRPCRRLAPDVARTARCCPGGRGARPRPRRRRPARQGGPAARRAGRPLRRPAGGDAGRPCPGWPPPPAWSPTSAATAAPGWCSDGRGSSDADAERVDRPARRGRRGRPARCWPRRSTSASARCAGRRSRSARAARDGARPRTPHDRPPHDPAAVDSTSGTRPAGARSAGDLTPHRVAEALRASGSPGRRRDRAGGPRACSAATSSVPDRWSRCCGCPASPTCWSTAPTRSASTAGPGWSATGGAVPRRRRRAPPRPAAGRHGRAAARRRDAVRRRAARRTAPASTPCWRRWRGPAPCCRCGSRGAGC